MRRSYLLSDSRLRRHEPRVDWQRVAAQSRTTSVPQLLHGVLGGRSHVGPPDQEGPEGAPEDGGQLPQVPASPRLFHFQHSIAGCLNQPFAKCQNKFTVRDHVSEEAQLRPERAGETQRT